MGILWDAFETESGECVPVPRFNGSNLSSWLSSMENFLVRFQIPEIQWVNFASHYVLGDAYSWAIANEYYIAWWNWAQFTAAISIQFDQVSRHVQVSSIAEEEDEEQQQQDKVVVEEPTFTQEMTTEESTVEVKVVEQDAAVEESKGVQSEDAKEEKNVEADSLRVSANNLKRQWYNINGIKSSEAKRKNSESNLLGVADRRRKKKEKKINIQSYHVHCVKSREIFEPMPEKDTAAYNAMINASVTAGNVDFARELFAVNGYAKEALALLRELLVDGDIPVTVDKVRVAAELAIAEKLIGDAAQNQAAMNPIHTVFDAKRFIGRRFSDASVLWPFKTTADQELKNWDNDFVKADQTTLFVLILAANYLNVNGGTPSDEKGIELILETEIVKADPASNLLITRNANICKRMKVHKTFELRVLPEDESWLLFKGKAGSGVGLTKFQHVAREIVRRCKGSPLAIVTLGSTLCMGEDEPVLDEPLHSKLMKAPKKLIDITLPGPTTRGSTSIRGSSEQIQQMTEEISLGYVADGILDCVAELAINISPKPSEELDEQAREKQRNGKRRARHKRGSPYQRGRGSPAYGRVHSRSLEEQARERQRYRKQRASQNRGSFDYGRGLSPGRRGRELVQSNQTKLCSSKQTRLCSFDRTRLCSSNQTRFYSSDRTRLLHFSLAARPHGRMETLNSGLGFRDSVLDSSENRLSSKGTCSCPSGFHSAVGLVHFCSGNCSCLGYFYASSSRSCYDLLVRNKSLSTVALVLITASAVFLMVILSVDGFLAWRKSRSYKTCDVQLGRPDPTNSADFDSFSIPGLPNQYKGTLPDTMEALRSGLVTRDSGLGLEQIVRIIAEAKKPVMYVGGGCLNSSKELRRFVELTGIPVASTLMGLGASPGTDELSLQMLGMQGTMVKRIDVVHGHNNVCRNPRWGRCYSEDLKIVQSIIPGLQGDLLVGFRIGIPYVGGKTQVADCAKHFVGEVFMTPADLMRAVVPVFPPSESILVREGYLGGELNPGELRCAPSAFFMLFDTNSDGLISFAELRTKLQPLSVAIISYEKLNGFLKQKEEDFQRATSNVLLDALKNALAPWQNVNPSGGRIPSQQYKKFLYAVDVKDDNYDRDDDPMRLCPDGIDQNPEFKPAWPDPSDMDEDTTEMLSEASARLNNARGNKAKKKAMKTQLEEARWVATVYADNLQAPGHFQGTSGGKTATVMMEAENLARLGETQITLMGGNNYFCFDPGPELYNFLMILNSLLREYSDTDVRSMRLSRLGDNPANQGRGVYGLYEDLSQDTCLRTSMFSRGVECWEPRTNPNEPTRPGQRSQRANWANGPSQSPAKPKIVINNYY